MQKTKTINVTEKTKLIFTDAKVLCQALERKEITENEFLIIILKSFWNHELKSIELKGVKLNV